MEENEDKIQLLILQFYQKLLGTPAQNILAIDLPLLKKGSLFPAPYSYDLVKRIAEEEVWTALKSMGDNKALGSDGFNVFFFLQVR